MREDARMEGRGRERGKKRGRDERQRGGERRRGEERREKEWESSAEIIRTDTATKHMLSLSLVLSPALTLSFSSSI